MWPLSCAFLKTAGDQNGDVHFYENAFGEEWKQIWIKRWHKS